jgi:beta-xylosidase
MKQGFPSEWKYILSGNKQINKMTELHPISIQPSSRSDPFLPNFFSVHNNSVITGSTIKSFQGLQQSSLLNNWKKRTRSAWFFNLLINQKVA